tara:strand:- start:284 stop:631 length:348 start_codon:yes stop_codon:yes gene_type:complete
MKIQYTGRDGIERETENVWVDWPDGYCWLVVNQWGVIGAVITMNKGETGWHEAYECAVDEIAHDYHADNQEELEVAMADGMAMYRGNGIPSNSNRESAIADTEYLTVIRPQSLRA